MNLVSKILIAVLILSGIMPLMASYFAIFNHQKIREMFNITAASTPDLEKSTGIIGSALIFAAVIQFLAAIWIWKRKEEGYSLSLWVGYMLIGAGLYMFIFFRLHHISDPFYLVDLVKGAVILMLTFWARKKTTKA